MLSSSTTGSNRKRAREERKEEKEEEEEEEEDGAGSSSVPEPASGEPLLKQACCFGGIIFPPVRVIKANIPALFTYLYIPEITESPAFGAVLSYMLRIHNRDGSYLPVPGPNPLDNLTVGCFLVRSVSSPAPCICSYPVPTRRLGTPSCVSKMHRRGTERFT